jgi:hypothetical protein
MSALARTTEGDCFTRAANEDFITGGSRTRTKFGYDNALRINSLSDTLFSSNGDTAGYDALDRLSSLAQTGVTSNWTYDANSNHLTQTGTSTVTTTPSTTSNRVNSISGSSARTYAYGAAGNTQSYTGASFGFIQEVPKHSSVRRMRSVLTTRRWPLAWAQNFIFRNVWHF